MDKDISWDAPGETEDKIHEYVSNILDMNHTTQQLLRERADEFALVARGFEQMAEWARDAADECRIKARQLADLSGDAISAEYQLVQVDPDEEEEEKGDDDE